ncbi:MAG: hypothetical protein WCJ61_14945 [Paludibacter sp.]
MFCHWLLVFLWISPLFRGIPGIGGFPGFPGFRGFLRRDGARPVSTWGIGIRTIPITTTDRIYTADIEFIRPNRFPKPVRSQIFLLAFVSFYQWNNV